MKELDDIARAAGVDTDSAEYRLATALAEADGDLLEQLVEARKAKGFTQQVIADRMRRDKSAVSNFERLGTDPHLSTIRRYAAAIGVMIKHDVHVIDTEVSYSESTPLAGKGFDARHIGFDAVLPSASMPTDVSWAEPEPINLAEYRRKRSSGVVNSGRAGARNYG